jgi:hypothetical protein
MNGESDTPFEQLTEAQQEELVEAMYQIYSDDIEGLIREFLKRHGASELNLLLQQLADDEPTS